MQNKNLTTRTYQKYYANTDYLIPFNLYIAVHDSSFIDGIMLVTVLAVGYFVRARLTVGSS